MKSPIPLLLSFAIASAVAVTSGRTFAEPYLFEVLIKPTYYKSWNALFAGENDIDSWLETYAKTKNGVATPGTVIQLGEAGYQINMVCKARDCGHNQFFVLFASNGTKAWGLLLKDGKTERFFGGPDEEKKQALRAVAYDRVAPVVTVVAIQSNEELRESDMTPTSLKRVEEWSVSMSRKKMSQSLERAGQNPNIAYQVPISSQSLFNAVGGKKLMIVRMTVDNSIREVTIMGFKGSEFYRVGCLRASNHDIPVFSGECGKVVKETFGVSIP